MKVVKSYKNETWARIRLPSKHKSKVYYISNRGRIKSVGKKDRSENLIKTNPDHRGHLRATIQLENGKNYPVWVHKEIAKQFVDKPSKKHQLIIHKNYDRTDNKLRNLKWVTKEDHKKYIWDRLRHFGYKPEGRITSNKLNVKQVAQIKKALLKGKTTKVKLSQKYGVSSTQLKRIERGENWSHVDPAK